MKPSNKNRNCPLRPTQPLYLQIEPEPVKPPSVNMSIVYVTVFAMIMITLFMYGA